MMKILFIVETSSIHAARWINQLKNTGWDIHVFQGVAPGNGVCEEFKCGTFYLPTSTPVPPGVTSRKTLPLNALTAKVAFRIPRLKKMLQARHAHFLPRLIKRLKPDVIHSLGLNVNWKNLCLPVFQARQILGEKKFKAPWLYSSWGADLDHFARQSVTINSEVRKILGAIDYHIAECDRDKRLAKELGFKGQSLDSLPAFGGVTWMDTDEMQQSKPVSSRKTIVLKGRDNTGTGGDPQGRAMTVMKAFSLCRDILSDYRIVIIPAGKAITNEANVLSATTNLNIQTLNHLPYFSWLRIVQASRLLLSATISDGLPSTLVEAMSFGVFPIFSDIESFKEWIKDGENGFLVPAENPQAFADAIRKALSDDSLVSQAAVINNHLIQDYLSDKVVLPKVIEMYNNVTKLGKGNPSQL